MCIVGGDVWQDRDGAFLPTHKRPLGYVFQEASLFAHLSVRRNLLFGAPRGRGRGPARAHRLRRSGRTARRRGAARPRSGQAFRRRAPAGRDRPGAAVAAQAPADGRAAVGARPRDQGRDPAVPRAAARSARAADRLHHPLDRRGRAPRRPDRAHRQGPGDRRRTARGIAERPGAAARDRARRGGHPRRRDRGARRRLWPSRVAACAAARSSRPRRKPRSARIAASASSPAT